MADRTIADRTMAEIAEVCARDSTEPHVVLDRLTSEEIGRHVYGNYDIIELLPDPEPSNLPLIKEEPVEPTRNRKKYVLEKHCATVKSDEYFMEGVKKELREIDEYTNDSSTFILSYGTYICNLCPQIIMNHNEFTDHFGVCHNINLPFFTCQICNIKFLLSSQLHSHMLHEHVNNLLLVNNLPAPCPATQSTSLSDSAITIPAAREISQGEPQSIASSSLHPVSQSTSMSNLVTRQTRSATFKITQGEPQSTTQNKLFKCLNCRFTTESELHFSRHRSNCSTEDSISYRYKLRSSLHPVSQSTSFSESSIRQTRSATFKIITQGKPKSTAQNTLLKCQNCSYETEYQRYFSRHKYNCMKMQSHSYRCKLRLKTLFIKHNKLASAKCNFCGAYITRRNMNRHIKNVHSEKI